MKIRSFAAAENLITVSRPGTCQTSTWHSHVLQ